MLLAPISPAWHKTFSDIPWTFKHFCCSAWQNDICSLNRYVSRVSVGIQPTKKGNPSKSGCDTQKQNKANAVVKPQEGSKHINKYFIHNFDVDMHILQNHVVPCCRTLRWETDPDLPVAYNKFWLFCVGAARTLPHRSCGNIYDVVLPAVGQNCTFAAHTDNKYLQSSHAVKTKKHLSWTLSIMVFACSAVEQTILIANDSAKHQPNEKTNSMQIDHGCHQATPWTKNKIKKILNPQSIST